MKYCSANSRRRGDKTVTSITADLRHETTPRTPTQLRGASVSLLLIFVKVAKLGWCECLVETISTRHWQLLCGALSTITPYFPTPRSQYFLEVRKWVDNKISWHKHRSTLSYVQPNFFFKTQWHVSRSEINKILGSDTHSEFSLERIHYTIALNQPPLTCK